MARLVLVLIAIVSGLVMVFKFSVESAIIYTICAAAFAIIEAIERKK
jgi:hypothetical protein